MLRFDIIKAVFRKELRESLRDRRSLAVMFGIPLVIYPLVTIGLSSLMMQRKQQMDEKVYSIAVENEPAAPELARRLRAKESGLSVVKREKPHEAMLTQNEKERIDAVLTIPKDFEQAALRSELGDRKLQIHVDGSRTESQVVENKIEEVIDEYEKWVVDQRLKARDLPPELLEPIGTVTMDVATAGQRLGKILGLALPNILLFTGMLGALFPAINAMTTEREVGTFEALLITPARKIELLLAKGALVLLASVVTALINLVSMSLVLWRVASLAERGGGALEVSFAPLALTFIAAMPALIFFSALTMLVALFARSFREANSYATPVMLIPLLSMGVSISEPETTPGLLVTPVVNTTLIIRDVLAGRATANDFLIAFVSSCLYAGLMMSWAARLFTSESLVNPSWEPLSWKGLKMRGGRGSRRLPAIDEALALFVVVLLLLFYVSPSFDWAALNREWKLFPALLGNEILLITATTLLFAWLGRYDIARTFSLRRPQAAVCIGSVLMGVGLAMAISLLTYLQQEVWKPSDQHNRQIAELIFPALLSHPILTIVGVGLLAGICEEIMFRGPIQAALARRLSMWPTLIVGSFLFAALHMDLHGLPIRMLISLFLAWLVYRGGSIFPAMIMHAVYDSAQLTQAWLQVRGMTTEQIVAMQDEPLTPVFWATVIAGFVLLAAGWWISRRSFRNVAEPLPGFEMLRHPARGAPGAASSTP